MRTSTRLSRGGRFRPACVFRAALLAVVPGLVSIAWLPACAAEASAPLVPLPEPFAIEGIIHAGRDLSGIARGDGATGILIADEGAVVQILEFGLGGNLARIIGELPLPGPVKQEIDLEGAAYDGGWFYVTGSHGVAKRSGEIQEPRCRVYRFRLAEGAPRDLATATLTPLLRARPALSQLVGRPLQEKGVNIEGLAARDGRLFFGFRSPNLGGKALVLEISAECLFEGAAAAPVWHELPLGPGLGIRSLSAAPDGGFFLVAGNAGSEAAEPHSAAIDFQPDRPSELFRWDPAAGTCRHLGQVPPGGAKEEAMLAAHDPTRPGKIRLLLLCDGRKGGLPRWFSLP
jgi:hypothetical protein